MPTQLRSCQAISTSNEASTMATFTLMTYNILAQALIKRELFPNSGNALKWKGRKNMLLDEFKAYKPHVMCLQEVDHVEDFYEDELKAIGYSIEYCKHPSKLHEIDYDTYKTTSPTQVTGNIAQCIALKHNASDAGLVIGNTHLYWRPQSFYERLRQSSIYIQTTQVILASLRCSHSNINWSYILAGDLNTTPTDPTYPSVIGKPLTNVQESWLEWSRREIMEDEEIPDNIETAAAPPKPTDIDNNRLVPTKKFLESIRNYPALKSVYSEYGKIDEYDVQIYGEPKFTHYGTFFKGTLDYIFISVDTKLECKELLRLPNEKDMEPGLPNGLFGSDHVPLMCRFAFT
ncbi:hypothetical protein NQZ79_g991 [Umbelopsis isabellina]|nr:hypothetical protein NQZ79_g991 [Umbelopsis isabellina]